MQKHLRLHISVSFIVLFLLGFPLLSYSQVDEGRTIIEEIPKEEEDEDRDYYFIYKEYREQPRSPELRKLPADKLREMADRKAFWYANTEFEKPEAAVTPSGKHSVPLIQRSWFQTLLWLLIIGSFAAFIMIYLTGDRIGLFRKKDITLASATDEESMPEDIFAINYQREIDKAEAQGNYRMAIRLMYLRLLKNMTDRGVISYSQEKTNFDYLMQVHPTAFYADFFRVTRDYEYSWYGKFDINEHSYQLIRKDFENFERKIS